MRVRRRVVGRASGPSSARPARSSGSTGSSRPTWKTRTTPAPSGTTGSAGCPRWPKATRWTALRLAASGHETRPPARYTEATLVRELEEREIGRPSTYASILGTILDRGYVFKKGTALVPSFLAFAVTTLLEQHFGHLVDYEFTARMEDALDQIARGEAGPGAVAAPVLLRLGRRGRAEGAGQRPDRHRRPRGQLVPAGRDSDIVVRVGRYGPYLERGDQRVNIPEGTAPDELTAERAAELFDQPSGDRELGTDPADRPPDRGAGGPVRALRDRTAGHRDRQRHRVGEAAHGVAAQVHDLETVTLEDALKLLSLPRLIGELDGEPVTAQNGRYGPYVKKGTDSRSLEGEEQLFDITLDEAKELFAQPKARGRRTSAAAPPLRELGAGPRVRQVRC